MVLPEELREAVPCRDPQLTQLLNIFSNDEEPIPPCLFFCGLKSSGKSFTVTKVLQWLNISYAQVDCVEGYLPRLLFESILRQLFGATFCEFKCEDLMSFISYLNRAAKNDLFCQRRNVIILERSERLRDMCPNLLPGLVRLRELCLLPHVCVVLTSCMVWEKFNPPGGLPPPIQLYFPQYSQDELVEVMLLNSPEEYPIDFYRQFLQMLVKVFYKYSCDLCELRYNAGVIFPKYCKPIKDGSLQISDTHALYSNVMHTLRSSVQLLYSRIDNRNPTSEIGNSYTGIQEKRHHLSSSAKFALSFELPYYAKFLLIAAYLASYNSSKEDKKLFVKFSGKTRKKSSMVSKKNDTNALMMGPKQFDLERLLAIFLSIVDEKPHISVNLLAQISSLVELQLLSKVGADAIECPKYKCVVGLDFILNISKTVGFTVTKYLLCYN